MSTLNEVLELRRLAGIERRCFLGHPVDNVAFEDVAKFVELVISRRANGSIIVQNANKMYLADKYPAMKSLIEQAALILPENAINIGMGVLGQPLKARNMGGVIVMGNLLTLAEVKGYTVYFLGATRENLDKMIVQLYRSLPSLKILGYKDGYFRLNETETVVEEIAALRPNLLFVGMGSPRQEIFIAENLCKLKVNIAMGVGGSFNVFAGVEKPAPAWTKHGLEWLYRSFQDPSKFRRYLRINSYFVYRLGRYFLLDSWRA